MSKPLVFDRPWQSELRHAEMDFLRRVIAPWQSELGLRTALDMGCGVGYFSAMLQGLGLQVTATDARSENIAEARKRHPGIDFRVAGVPHPLLQLADPVIFKTALHRCSSFR